MSLSANKRNFITLAPVALCTIPDATHYVHIRAMDGTRFHIELRLKAGCVSITGLVFDKWAKTPYAVGQIVDTLDAYGYVEQARLWNEWHLNDYQAGTDLQQCEAGAGDYEERCSRLAACGLLIDRGYKYGSGWLVKEITLGEWVELLAAFDRVATK
jgi:hypothetical protein